MGFAPRRLTQQFVEGLAWTGKRLFVRDTDLKGFMVVVNRTSKSYMVQRDVWKGPRGNRKLLGPRRRLVGRTNLMPLKEAKDAARDMIAAMVRGEEPNARQNMEQRAGVTLREALASYLGWLTRKNRQPRTLTYYSFSIERYLNGWLDEPLAAIGANRRAIRERHLEITKSNGPYAANAAMRCLRAVYRYERRANPALPENPVDSHDFNGETPRNKFVKDLPAWKAKVEALNPIKRDLMFFVLFSGMRRRAACAVKWGDLNEEKSVLHVPSPKGGPKKRFDLPLSSFLIDLLKRRREKNEILYPSSPWVFPSADSRTGHIVEPKQKNLPGCHQLRHSFATYAIAAGISWSDLQMLLNHATPGGVTGGYVHEEGLLVRLQEQQEKVSAYLLQHMNKPVEQQERPATEQTGAATTKQGERKIRQEEATP